MELFRKTNQHLVLFVFAIVVCAVMMPPKTLAAEMNDMEAEEVDNQILEEKMTRRSDVSRALALLKKHSIVGKDAKIILKPSGKHLLIDSSDRLQIVHDTGRRRSASLTASSSSSSSRISNKRSSSSNIDKLFGGSTTNNHKSSKKSSKLTGNNKKSATRKRSSGSRTNKAVNHSSHSRKRSTKRKPSSSSSSSSFSSSSVELLQKTIMNVAASRSPVIVDSLMASHMLEEMSRLVTAIVRNKRANSLSELSDLITETLDERYGPHWHTISVASQRRINRKSTRNSNVNEILVDIGADGDREHQLSTMTHIAIDDHRKAAIFYATFDFGNTLRIFVFK